MKQSAFAKWLNSIPSLEDENPQEITLNVSVTLTLEDWAFLIQVAALHGQTAAECVNQMVADACCEDCVMNRKEHLGECRQRELDELSALTKEP